MLPAQSGACVFLSCTVGEGFAELLHKQIRNRDPPAPLPKGTGACWVIVEWRAKCVHQHGSSTHQERHAHPNTP